MSRDYKKQLTANEDRHENISLSLTLDTRRQSDLYPVAVRVNANRKNWYYRTGMKVSTEEWEKICKARGRGVYFDLQNEQIEIFKKVLRAVKELSAKNIFSFENLKAKLTGKETKTFNEHWKQFAESKKVGTKTAYLSALTSFEKFVGENVAFSHVDKSLIEKWDKGMKKNDSKKVDTKNDAKKKKVKKEGLSNTTAGMYFRACRAVINDCIQQGKIKQSQYPFGRGKVEIKKGRSRKDEYITIPTIKQIIAFKAPEKWPEYYSNVVYEAINLWLFSYLGNGLNLADMALLKYDKHYFQSNETELKFIRQKTADTSEEDIEIIIPIIPELKNILEKYGAKPEPGAVIFPQILNGEIDELKIKKIVSQWNSNIRDRLQAACKLLEINKTISMTWARHSFATNLTHAGVSERYISQAMGHSLKSVTQGYIGLFSPEKRMSLNKMLLE